MISRFFKPARDLAEVELQDKLLKFNIKLDLKSGHLFYTDTFVPLKSSFQLVFVRHGQTYGNCGQSTSTNKIDHDLVARGELNEEKRIFQGNVDSEINQLTTLGKTQALNASIQLEEKLLANDWHPDVVLYSPLTRARDTASPFIERNKLQHCSHAEEGIREMAFGPVDNERVCDIKTDDPWHLFYREQNALVNRSGLNKNGVYQIAENFAEVLLRARNVLLKLEEKYAGKKIVMFSHSMFGAACSILYGRGRQYDNENYLAFDGKNAKGEYYVMPNAQPIFLNFELTMPQKTLLKVF